MEILTVCVTLNSEIIESRFRYTVALKFVKFSKCVRAIMMNDVSSDLPAVKFFEQKTSRDLKILQDHAYPLMKYIINKNIKVKAQILRFIHRNLNR